METKTITVTNKDLVKAKEECQANETPYSKHCIVAVAVREHFDVSLFRVGVTELYLGDCQESLETWHLDSVGKKLVLEFDNYWRDRNYTLEKDITFQINKG